MWLKENFLRLLVLFIAYVSTTKAVEIQGCTVSADGSSICTLTDGTTKLAQNKYCISSNVIYKGDHESSGHCVTQTETPLLIKADFTKGTVGTDSGFIYTYGGSTYTQVTTEIKIASYFYICDSDKNCAKIHSTYHLVTDPTPANNKLYSCDKNGKCTEVTTITKGYYINESSMIYCSGTTTASCQDLAIENILPGYYPNVGSDKNTYQMIKCNRSLCEKLQVSKTYCEPGEQEVGGLILDQSNIKICLGIGESYLISSSATSDVYKTIQIGKANDFPGAAVGKINIKINKDGSVTELVSISSLKSCTVSDSTCNNCDSGKYYLGDNNNVYLCGANKAITLVKKQGLPTCTVSVDKCSNSCTNGEYNIDNNGKIYLCGAENAITIIEKTKLGLASDAATGTGYVYFDKDNKFIDITTATNPVIENVYQCTVSGAEASSISCELITHGYILDIPRTKSVSCSGLLGENCVVSSTASSCSNSDEGKLMVSGNNKKLCFGSSRSVDLPTTGTPYVALKFKNFNTIYGIGSGEIQFLKLTPTLITIADQADAVEVGYHLNVNVSGSKYESLIKCGTVDDLSTCKIVNSLNGYYLNSGSDKETNKAIKCTNSGCTNFADTATSCNKVGEVKIIDSDVSLCIQNTGSTKNVHYLKIKEVSGTVYKSYTIVANTFPETVAGEVVLKYDAEKVVLMEEESLPECSSSTNSVCFSGATEGQYCINSASKKIFKTTLNKCNEVTGRHETENFYFNNDYKMVDNLVANSQEVAMAYQCTFNSDTLKVESCQLVKGYLITPKLYIHCNGWKGEGCTVTSIPSSDNCGSGDVDGIYKFGGKLCFGDVRSTAGYPLPAKKGVIAFKLTGVSSVYGISSGVVLLSVSKKQAFVVTNPSGNDIRYYVNQNSNTDATNLIKCTGNSCDEATGNLLSSNKGHAYIDSGDLENKSLITCADTGQGCVSSQDFVYNYIDASDINEKKIIVCSEDNGCTSSTGNTSNKVYIDGTAAEHDYIISCDNTKCSSEKVTVAFGQGHVYLDALKSGNVITCDYSGSDPKCKSEEGVTTQGSAYIDKSQFTTVTIPERRKRDTTKKCYKNIITCADGVCLSVAKTSESYFIDATNNKKIIQCKGDPFECTSDDVDAGKFYVDGTNPSRYVISCHTNYGCLSTLGITFCSTDTPIATALCKYKNASGADVDLSSNTYCMTTAGKIYYSKEEGNTKSCNQVTATDPPIILEMNSSNSLFNLGKVGTTKKGLIYICNGTGNVCTQYFGTNYLYVDSNDDTVKKFYKCDLTGECSEVNQPSIGFYLSGEPTIAASITYSKMVQCTSNEVKDCTEDETIDTDDEGDYIDSATPGNIISCTNPSCSSTKGNTNSGVVYIDKSKEKISGTTPYNQFVIKCNNNSCESMNVCTNIIDDHNQVNYFIDGSTTNKIIECKYDDSGDDVIITCASTDCSGPYLDGFNINNTITCGTPCVSEPECRVSTGSNCEDKTYYLVKASTIDTKEYLLDDSDVNKLFYCKKNESGVISCSMIEEIGYYVNNKDNTAFSCADSSGIKCKKETISTGKCEAATDIGSLFINNNYEISLCVNFDSSATTLTLSITNQLILLQYSASNNIFGLEADGSEYALTRVNENSVTLAKDYNYEKSNYVYVNTETFDVLSNDTCPLRITNTGFNASIKEYTCDKDTAICTAVVGGVTP